MARRLNTFVHVHINGEHVVYGPDDTVPPAAAKLIGNPAVWDDDGQDEPADSGPAGIPPKNGKGSGQEAWLAYATEVGLKVPEGAKKKEIIALVEANVGAPLPVPALDAELDEWRAYAAASGFEMDDDADVDDIVSALTAEGIATE